MVNDGDAFRLNLAETLFGDTIFSLQSLVILSTCYKSSKGKWMFSVNSMEDQIIYGLIHPQHYGHGATIELSQLVAFL